MPLRGGNNLREPTETDRQCHRLGLAQHREEPRPARSQPSAVTLCASHRTSSMGVNAVHVFVARQCQINIKVSCDVGARATKSTGSHHIRPIDQITGVT